MFASAGIVPPPLSTPRHFVGEERMSIHGWMLTGLLLGATPVAAAEKAPIARLEKGLEIVWRGTFSEAVLRPNVRAFRAYEIETRVFVMDVCPQGTDIALFTSIKFKPDVKVTPEPVPIVRLELARVDPQGKLSLLPASALMEMPEKRKPIAWPLMPLEGLPTLEPSLFVAFPTENLKPGQTWEVAENKRPPLVFRFEGFDSVHGSRCLKIKAIQQTDDWETPSRGQIAWRRGETISVSMKHGYTARLERTIEKRDPQTGDLGFRSKLAYEHVGGFKYPDRFGEDRRQEIVNAIQFADLYEQLLPEAGRSGENPFEQLLQRIEEHLSSHLSGEAVPYREAVLQVKRKAAAARRGNIPPAPSPPEISETPTLTVGKCAAEFTAVDLTNGESVRLTKMNSKPVVLLYYQPASAKTAKLVLDFAERLQLRYGEHALILPLAIGSSEAALQQRNELKLSVHVYSGRDVYKLHAIESTPCFAVIDEHARVKQLVLGWSDENVAAIEASLENGLK